MEARQLEVAHFWWWTPDTNPAEVSAPHASC